MELRDYQIRALDEVYAWWREHPTGHPVIEMPGGSGKSAVIAALARDACTQHPGSRVLMLVHSKELIVQNAARLLSLWPEAEVGIYSASVGRREMGRAILYAGIGSVAKRAQEIGHVDLVIIDEAHTVSPLDQGQYRSLLNDLLKINPALRLVGLSASPYRYRLGHGLITKGKDAIFTEILKPVEIPELLHKGHFVPLRSKNTDHKLSAEGAHKRGGEYIAADLERLHNTDAHNGPVVAEIIRRAQDRAHWLVFCAGVAHAEAISRAFESAGVPATSLDAGHSKFERERRIAEFESGRVRALCNVGILTTGYDFPALDCIVFLRATMSPGLYLQMAYRGTRPAPGKKDCLVLDFAGVVAQHGPITAVQPPKKRGNGDGPAPVKPCPACDELCPLAARKCDACGYEFPPPAPVRPTLHHDDIMGDTPRTMAVSAWQWRVRNSQNNGLPMLVCTYYGHGLGDPAINEFFCVLHPSAQGGGWARRRLLETAHHSGVSLQDAFSGYESVSLDRIALQLNNALRPEEIAFKKRGKFFDVVSKSWSPTHGSA